MRIGQKKNTRRRSLTLIEMIIVMMLIATITGAIAVNYQSSLDKGRYFATERKIERLKAIAHIYFAEHPDAIGQQINWDYVIAETGLGAGKPGDLLKDDWGNAFKIDLQTASDGSLDVVVSTDRFEKERQKRK